jgi:hypothetical protein
LASGTFPWRSILLGRFILDFGFYRRTVRRHGFPEQIALVG